MKNSIIAFLSGALVITLSVCIYLLKNMKPIINTDQYVEELQQKVGKIKQRGEGNSQQVEQQQEVVTRKKKRLIKKAARSARRNHANATKS